MIDPKSVIADILPKCYEPAKSFGYGEAPVNIALIKYWGKRCQLFNLPVTDSLSVTVPNTLTRTRIWPKQGHQDRIILNQQLQSADSPFAKRLSTFLDFFRHGAAPAFEVDTHNTVATAAGLASSASGFAALVLALNDLFAWQLNDQSLSMLARMGSGSACRSLWPGFVHWQAGTRPDGLDSFAQPLNYIHLMSNDESLGRGDRLVAQDETGNQYAWPGLMLGLVIVESHVKPISSREAMQLTRQTSPLYQVWPATVSRHLAALLDAMVHHDFARFGAIAEHNALAMHATMLASWPSVDYRIPATSTVIQQVYQLRRDGVPVYFTQDAGPNIKLLFEAQNLADIQAAFPTVITRALFT